MYTLDYIKKVQGLFEKMGCAQLHDAAPKYTMVLNELGIKPRNPGKNIAGPVFPVITDNDMLPCLQALDNTPEGYVLFIHNNNEESQALAGDIFVTAAYHQGLSGLVINGAIRDIDFLPEINLPVFSKEVTYVSAKTAKVPAVEVPIAVKLEQAVIEPGDWIFGDSDGLLLVKNEYFSAVLSGAILLQKREDELKSQISKGGRMSELCGLTEFLAGRAPLRFEV